MVTESKIFKMGIIIGETISMESPMDLESISGQMQQSIKVNLLKGYEKAREIGLVKLAISIMVILAGTGKMATGSTFGQMETSTKDSFAKI